MRNIVANRLMGELTLPFHLDDKEVYTSASIGIAVSTSGYQRPEEFLRDADTAMYRAKSLGKARYEVFDADMRASVTYRLQLETDLRHALERNEFMNFYQPIISLETGKLPALRRSCAGNIRREAWSSLASLSRLPKKWASFVSWVGGGFVRPAGRFQSGESSSPT